MSRQLLDEVFTFLLAGGKGERLYPLTMERAKPAVPFGGKFRIIDFALSNCINSGIRKVAVATQYKSSSLSRHLALGWSFLNSRLGEYIVELPPQQRYGEKWYTGTADAVYQNLYYISSENIKYVFILSGDHIYKMDYKDMLAFHISKEADITIGTVIIQKDMASNFGIMQVDGENKIIGFREKPRDPPTLPEDADLCLASMGIYIFNKDVLTSLLEHDENVELSSHDFGKDVIPYAIRSNLNVFAFRFFDKDGKQGYWQDVGTINAFYEANMDLLSNNPKIDIYDRSWPIFTHDREYPPVKITFSEVNGVKVNSSIEDSIISDGSLLYGAKILHSVIFYDVKVGPLTTIEDSIIFGEVEIGKNVKIKRAIVDKFVRIPDNVSIGYDDELDQKYFYVTPSKIVVLHRGFAFPKSLITGRSG